MAGNATVFRSFCVTITEIAKLETPTNYNISQERSREANENRDRM